MYIGFRKCIYDSENVYRIQKMYNSIEKMYIDRIQKMNI